MAAPVEAYLHKKLNLNSNSLLIAKFLVNTTPTTGTEWGDGYFNEGDTKVQAETKIKEIFHLDELLKVKSVSPDYFGFIGAVNPNGPNAAYRNINKLSGAKTVTTPLTFSLLTDSLTTKGHCETQSNILKYANLVLNNAFFRSAYYLDSTSFGFRYKINDGSWIYQQNQNLLGIIPQTLPKKNIFTDDLYLFPSGKKGDNVSVQSYIENNEGVYYGDEHIVTLDEEILNLLVFLRDTPTNSEAQTETSIWIMEPDFNELSTLTTEVSATNIFAYTSPFKNAKIPSGWYVGILDDKALFVDNIGQFTHYYDISTSVPEYTLTCAVMLNMTQRDEPPTHNSILFTLDKPAHLDILISGFVSRNPDTMNEGFSFSIVLPRDSTEVICYTGAGFVYSNPPYYLSVGTPGNQYINKVGTGIFLF